MEQTIYIVILLVVVGLLTLYVKNLDKEIKFLKKSLELSEKQQQNKIDYISEFVMKSSKRTTKILSLMITHLEGGDLTPIDLDDEQ